MNENFIKNNTTVMEDNTVRFQEKDVSVKVCRKYMLFSMDMGLPEPKIELWKMQQYPTCSWTITERYQVPLTGSLITFAQ